MCIHRRVLMWIWIAVVAVLGPANAHARSELSLAAGLHVPLGAIYDDANVGPEAGLGFGIALTPSFSIGASYTRQRNSLSDEFKHQRLGDTEAAGEIESWTAALYLRALFHPSAVKPYVRVQAGVSHLEVVLDDRASSAVDSHLSLSGGLGVQFGGTGRLGGYTEVLVHRVFVDENQVESRPQRDKEDQLRTFASVRAGLILFVDWI